MIVSHTCITEKKRDETTVPPVEQFLVRCRCHMNSWWTWQAGDEEMYCPDSGTSLTDRTGR